MRVPDYRPGSKVTSLKNHESIKKGKTYTIKYNTIRGDDVYLLFDGVDGFHKCEMFQPKYIDFAPALEAIRTKVINTAS